MIALLAFTLKALQKLYTFNKTSGGYTSIKTGATQRLRTLKNM